LHKRCLIAESTGEAFWEEVARQTATPASLSITQTCFTAKTCRLTPSIEVTQLAITTPRMLICSTTNVLVTVARLLGSGYGEQNHQAGVNTRPKVALAFVDGSNGICC